MGSRDQPALLGCRRVSGCSWGASFREKPARCALRAARTAFHFSRAMTAGLCQSSLLSGALRSRRRASGCPSAPRCSAGESNGNGNGGAEHLARAGVTELLSSSGSLSHGDSANSSLRKKRRGGGQRANGVPADFVARASELEALGSITKLELGTQVEEEAAQSSAHRTTGKAPFYLVRTDGFICTREKVDGTPCQLTE